jgi:hypothetical protein
MQGKADDFSAGDAGCARKRWQMGPKERTVNACSITAPAPGRSTMAMVSTGPTDLPNAQRIEAGAPHE